MRLSIWLGCLLVGTALIICGIGLVIKDVLDGSYLSAVIVAVAGTIVVYSTARLSGRTR